ncbi:MULTISPECIES: FagA protein [unclassified Pseudomonas]|uniref:FagA protein n=1 Tax=unclassified Pseudomonas TaxID=196821 RepID=UPI000D3C9EBE|nr:MULTISPECIES: FagA protein [unclassified Pseudomonas]RAU49617.1 FagA protein [Pseudomonas sp. RIT 409]RAU55644.1 FagA protein [Pseudomonas sp. RIT 412]
MTAVLHESPYLENWRALSLRIRCGLDPDEPRLIEHYLAEGRYLARFTATPPMLIAQSTFSLLIDTARDTALPWHWRCLCLDQTWRPLRDLQALAHSDRQRQHVHALARQLATCVLQPSISFAELMQGSSDE